jgi:hypothetical protein
MNCSTTRQRITFWLVLRLRPDTMSQRPSKHSRHHRERDYDDVRDKRGRVNSGRTVKSSASACHNQSKGR